MKSILVLAPLAVALITAGCGSGAAPTSASPAARVATAHTKLGTVLVDARGRTLYLFEKDHGSSSSCYGSCASVWPPLLTGADPAAGAGTRPGRLGSSRRRDGKRIVTYSGHPLYTYAGDSRPGDVHGQGADQFGAPWYVLAPSGAKIDDGK